MNLPGAFSTARLPERVRTLVTQLNLHYAGAALLLVLNMWLAVALILAGRTASSSGADALAQQQTSLRLAELQARPLEGLDTKLITATSDADLFYQRRLPSTWSQVLGELGALTHRENVKLTRVQYAPVPVLEASSTPLTEIHMDAVLTGDYRSLVLFVNSLERDRMFFLITAVTLTGQQSGVVGLRLRLNTWLRPEVPDAGLGASEAANSDGYSATPGSGEGAPSVPHAQSAAYTRDAVSSRGNANAAPQASFVSPAQTPRSTSPSSQRSFTPPTGGPPEVRSGRPAFNGENAR